MKTTAIEVVTQENNNKQILQVLENNGYTCREDKTYWIIHTQGNPHIVHDLIQNKLNINDSDFWVKTR